MTDAVIETNVYSFVVRKVDRSRRFLKDLRLERVRYKRIEVNAHDGKIRICSMKNPGKAIEYFVGDLKSVERTTTASCLKLVYTDNKEYSFKFNTKAGMEMLFDLLQSLREDFPCGSEPIRNGSNSDSSSDDLKGPVSLVLPKSTPSHGLVRRSSVIMDKHRSSRLNPPSFSPRCTLFNPHTSHDRMTGIHRPETVQVFCTTFNMGNSRPPTTTALRKWIATTNPFITQKTVSFYDIYAISVQERSYDVEVSTAREHWQDTLSSLFPEHTYMCLTHIDSWDRSLTIYVRHELEHRIQQLEADTVNVGVGGVAGNKGAIGVKFSLYDTTFCFVNSHLAAHQYEVAKRNADFSEIVRLLKLRDSPFTDVTTSAYHHVFWMGDLNYRITLTRSLCVDLIRTNQWNDLNSMDQLTSEKASGKEGKLIHPPTYKLVRGDVFDDNGRRVYSDDKGRVPAWTDRILYKSLRGASIELIEYGAINYVTTSDHSPVYAIFRASLTHTSGLRSMDTMLRIAKLEDPYYIVFNVVKARALRSEALAPGEIQLIFDPKILAGNKAVKSTALRDTTTPTWGTNDIPKLCTIENKHELMAKKYLQITCRARENSYSTKKQDFIASSIVWLGQEPNEEGYIEFNEPLLRHGVKIGSLSGSFRVEQTGQDSIIDVRPEEHD